LTGVGEHADPLLRRLKDAQRRGLAGLQLLEQLVVDGELSDAAVGEALQKIETAEILVVDP
jgi:hypothetical protein